MHFRHLWLIVGFSRWSRELTSHHPHFIFVAYKILFFDLSGVARKAWKPGQHVLWCVGKQGGGSTVARSAHQEALPCQPWDTQAVPHLS